MQGIAGQAKYESSPHTHDGGGLCMKQQAVFLSATQEINISKTSTPEFYRLYEQSVLWALQKEGFLTESQLQYALLLLENER